MNPGNSCDRFAPPQRAVLLFALCAALLALPACKPSAGTTGAQQTAAVTAPGNQADKKPRFTNRLADETSPYLLMHAHNPVDWYPWGSEAFEKAKKEGKLVFLSIGYSSCFWCHVMEREVFSDPEIAKAMNEHFVCIKVDREERPDLDDVYMTALQLYLQFSGSQQGGGWPLSMFLTPEGDPIAGGSYFPPEDRQGMIGFPTVLGRMQELWTTQREGVENNAAEFAGIVRRTMRQSLPLKQVDLSPKLVEKVKQELTADYDEQYGGFGATTGNPLRPKFPEPSNLLFLLHEYQRSDDKDALAMVRGTLDAMAAGGIRDHLGGGFHRYSTDPQWRVPHFEKMLYDNAQLADVYVRAFAATKDPQYRRVAEEVFAFVARELTGPEGGFYTALDAESEEEEGKFYVWTAEEVEQALGKKDAELFNKVYGLSNGPNFEQRANVLLLPKPLATVAAELQASEPELRERLAGLRERLLKLRDQRARPLLDDKALTAWNGLMIRALADAGPILEEPRYTDTAARAAEFVLAKLRDGDGRLLRSYRMGQAKLAAYLDDYAFLIEGLLALHEATGDQRWLDEAVALTDVCLAEFSDDANQAFYFTSNRHEKLLARTKDPFDSALPSGNSIMASNLLRLAEATGEGRYRARAEKVLKSFAPLLDESPTALPNMAVALGRWLDDETEE